MKVFERMFFFVWEEGSSIERTIGLLEHLAYSSLPLAVRAIVQWVGMIVVGTTEVCLFAMHFHSLALEEAEEGSRSCKMMEMLQEEEAVVVVVDPT